MLQESLFRNEPIRESHEDELLLTIESLRGELLEVAMQRSLSDRVVVELSERLDGYILLAQNKMMENLRKRQSSGRHRSETSHTRRRTN